MKAIENFGGVEMTLREAVISTIKNYWDILDEDKRNDVGMKLDELEKFIGTLQVEQKDKVSLQERILETVRRIC